MSEKADELTDRNGDDDSIGNLQANTRSDLSLRAEDTITTATVGEKLDEMTGILRSLLIYFQDQVSNRSNDSCKSTSSSAADITTTEDPVKENIRLEIKTFEEDLLRHKITWSTATNDDVVDVLKSKELYTDAAAKTFTGLFDLHTRLQSNGCTSPFHEKEAREMIALCDNIKKTKSPTRNLWLAFLHEVCSGFFNPKRPTQTGETSSCFLSSMNTVMSIHYILNR
jgi:hypothetical protein